MIDQNQRLQPNRVALFVEKKEIKKGKPDQHRLLDQPVMFEILVRIAKGRAPNSRINIGGVFIDVRAACRERERINGLGNGFVRADGRAQLGKLNRLQRETPCATRKLTPPRCARCARDVLANSDRGNQAYALA